MTLDAGQRQTDGAVVAPGGFQVHLTADPDTTLCRGTCVQLTASAEHGVAPYRYQFDHGLGQGATHRVCPTADTTYQVSATDASFDVEFGSSNVAATRSLTIRVSDCATPGVEAGVDAGSLGIDAAVADASGAEDAGDDPTPRQTSVLCAKPVASIDARVAGSFDLWNEAFATKIAVDRAGGVRLATTLTGAARVANGTTLKNTDALARSVLLAKVSADCTPLWALLVHGSVEAFDPIVAVDSQGRTVLFARTRLDEAVNGSSDALYLAAVSADGALLWEKRVGAAVGSISQRALRIDANDDIVIMSAAQGGSDFGGGPMGSPGNDAAMVTVLAKYRSSGDHIWSKPVQPGASGASLAIHNGTDIFLHGWSDTPLDWGAAGRTASTQAGQGHGYLVRADANGSFVWSRLVTDGASTQHDRPHVHSLDVIPSSRLVLGDFPVDNELSVAQLDGERIWSQRVVEAASPSVWHETAVDTQGNIILSGSFDDSARIRGVTLTTSAQSVEAAFVQKVDPLGRTVWTFPIDTVRPDPYRYDTLLGAVPDSQGNVFALVNALNAKAELYIIKLAN